MLRTFLGLYDIFDRNTFEYVSVALSDALDDLLSGVFRFENRFDLSGIGSG